MKFLSESGLSLSARLCALSLLLLFFIPNFAFADKAVDAVRKQKCMRATGRAFLDPQQNRQLEAILNAAGGEAAIGESDRIVEIAEARDFAMPQAPYGGTTKDAKGNETTNVGVPQRFDAGYFNDPKNRQAYSQAMCKIIPLEKGIDHGSFERSCVAGLVNSFNFEIDFMKKLYPAIEPVAEVYRKTGFKDAPKSLKVNYRFNGLELTNAEWGQYYILPPEIMASVVDLNTFNGAARRPGFSGSVVEGLGMEIDFNQGSPVHFDMLGTGKFLSYVNPLTTSDPNNPKSYPQRPQNN